MNFRKLTAPALLVAGLAVLTGCPPKTTSNPPLLGPTVPRRSLLIDAILANDTPVIMAVTFVFACLVVLFNLIADILYGWLDPRITFR